MLATQVALVLAGGCESRPDVPCLRVPKCSAGAGRVHGFYLTTAPANNSVPAKQLTDVSICYGDAGFTLLMNASDNNIFTASGHCNDPVFSQGGVLEFFAGPVNSATDDPIYYHEIDSSPSGVMWAGVSENMRGTAHNCDLGRGVPPTGRLSCPAPGQLQCAGRATFPGTDGLTVRSVNNTGGPAAPAGTPGWWQAAVTVPWKVYSGYFTAGKPATAGPDGGPWRLWRMNFYRYDYPNPPDTQHYELSGWSPTHDPSFHVPQRFGVVELV
eukprot:TRINITY_DN32915_c0_g1_i1.p1 TRINITY_DN32915_c0_g1~~TRINITY_DN32915_c0_g1_i1.p1  ORF type:complete len:286 (+),score=43.32 TRINITY_DN32915_c0_g1_i1:51-860(+)